MMTDTKKIKRTALTLFAAASLALLLFIVQMVRGFVLNTAEWYVAGIATFSIGVLIMSATLVIALILLLSIRRDETPFTMKNVKRLKAIAILLAALEPYQLVSEWIFNNLYPIVISDNTTVSVHTSWGGCIFAAGLVVYSISLVFEYGIYLQNQIDETL